MNVVDRYTSTTTSAYNLNFNRDSDIEYVFVQKYGIFFFKTF